ncbi:MAG: HU family DNA-binding protein [Elusimicrobiota bacterium]|nr:HU family DNA-binding protein [Elusimicrobiota bacterium]
MNKNDLVLILTKVLGSKTDAKKAIETIFSAMKEAIKSGEKVVISNFGSFHTKVHRAKKFTNPKTKETILIPPRRKVSFKLSKNLLSF